MRNLLLLIHLILMTSKVTYIFFISFNRTSYKHNDPHLVIFALPVFQYQLGEKN